MIFKKLKVATLQEGRKNGYLRVHKFKSTTIYLFSCLFHHLPVTSLCWSLLKYKYLLDILAYKILSNINTTVWINLTSFPHLFWIGKEREDKESEVRGKDEQYESGDRTFIHLKVSFEHRLHLPNIHVSTLHMHSFHWN